MRRIFILVLAVTLSFAAQAKKHTVCVFDIVGAHGDVFNLMKDYQLEALNWGVDIELKPYTDEKIASEDFKAGQCSAVVLTGLRGRLFNSFTGSLDSIGSIPSYKHMKKVIQVLSHPKYAPRMKSGPYEVIGVAPLGAAYLFVNDRRINNVSALSGKKIAVLDYDKSQAKMVAQVGASAVSSDVTNFAGKFNNGSVDICAAPAVAYSALELYKGLADDGGIVNYPLAQLSLQLIVRHDQFPAEFGQQSRTYFYSQFDRAKSLIDSATAEIDKKWWIEIPANDKIIYDELMRESRISLRDEGIYDKDMMSLLRKVRCKLNPAHAECTEKLE